MAMKMHTNLSIKQQQRQELKMTQQLQQAIQLLQLTKLELIDTIQQELIENPTLEEIAPADSLYEQIETGEPPADPYDTEDLSKSLQSLDRNINKTDDIDWDAYLNQYQTHTPLQDNSYKGTIAEDLPSYEATLASPPTLHEYLMQQMQCSTLNEEQCILATEIIGNINEDGYLVGVTLEELAQKCNINIESAEYTLATIQEFEPIGVGARTLSECLGIQAELLYPEDDVLALIIKDCIPLLERKNYDLIARNLRISIDNVIRAAKIIITLNPKPGITYSSDKPLYVTPDVFIEKINNTYRVVINDEGLPKLRISPYYAQLIKNASHEEASNYIKDKMTSARWFLRSIQEREKTIYKVTQAIIERQKEFFEKGIKYLKPMVLKDIAEDTELSESTISRVTNKKFAHTPQGTFELKFFFNSKIKHAGNGDDVASESVKELIRSIIASENPQKPYSDQKIAKLLQSKNIAIARRTIAKYREALGILSSSQRKDPFADA